MNFEVVLGKKPSLASANWAGACIAKQGDRECFNLLNLADLVDFDL